MSISFEKAVGSAERALIYRSQRAEVLSNNIANSDTPNFKSRDLDFPTLLSEQSNRVKSTPSALKTTDQKHIAANGVVRVIDEPDLLYVTPSQPSIDQNTVDQQVEIAKYTENEIHFEAAFTRLNGAFKGLINALRGE